MSRPKVRSLAFATCLALLCVLAVSVPASADSITFPDPVSPNGAAVRNLYNLISIPAIIVFLFVEGWILFVIVRYRRSRQPAGYLPPQWHGNRRLELIWTLIPLVIVLTIASASFLVLQSDFTKRTDQQTQMDVTVVGYQFAWEYDYPQGFKSTGKLVVPVNTLVRLRMVSRDVIHSWWVPNVTGKTDTVPGYDNFTWLKIDRTGTWHGQCAELCGAAHYTMTTEVEAMSQSDFQAWVQQQEQKAKQSPSPSASASP